MSEQTLVERLREWADYIEKRMTAPSGNPTFVTASDHKLVRDAASALSAAEERIKSYERAWNNLARLLPRLPSPEAVAYMNTDPWTEKEKAALAAYRASEEKGG